MVHRDFSEITLMGAIKKPASKPSAPAGKGASTSKSSAKPASGKK
jgi:hypothetical protein